MAFITAANQIGKSSILIIKTLNLAFRKELWEAYFRRAKPSLFLYMYPDVTTGKIEFYEKWEKVYLPKKELKDDPVWGWKMEKGKDGSIDCIKFASGVTCVWKYYSQKTTSMQAISIDFAGLDEEIPEAHFDELMVRTTARAGLGSGLVSTVFTATLSQPYLYDTMERQGQKDEKFPGAFKRQVSLYDCLTYADGTPSEIFTKERIETSIIPMYSSEKEILRRVWGRFIKDSGLVFAEFESKLNTTSERLLDLSKWNIYCGIDFGSGGKTGHPSAITFVAVDEEYFKARVFYAWKSPKEERITQSDLLEKYKELKITLGVEPSCFYDWSATDLGLLAAREGVSMLPANKNHEHGVGLMNSLFRSQQLLLCTGPGSGFMSELILELSNINQETSKQHRRDDQADALRYALSMCPMRVTRHVKEARPIKAGPKCPRMRFYAGSDLPDEELPWGEDIDQMLEEAAQLFGD